MGASIGNLTIVVSHMTKSIEPLGLVVWHDMGQPKSNWVVLMSGITTWFIVL
jgi:hypothetical protein